MNEKVNHPLHYNMLPASCNHCGESIECIDVVRHLNFNLGNAIKYIWRVGYKDGDGITDLKKALWYLQDEINKREQYEKVYLETSQPKQRTYRENILRRINSERGGENYPDRKSEQSTEPEQP